MHVWESPFCATHNTRAPRAQRDGLGDMKECKFKSERKCRLLTSHYEGASRRAPFQAVDAYTTA